MKEKKKRRTYHLLQIVALQIFIAVVDHTCQFGDSYRIISLLPSYSSKNSSKNYRWMKTLLACEKYIMIYDFYWQYSAFKKPISISSIKKLLNFFWRQLTPRNLHGWLVDLITENDWEPESCWNRVSASCVEICKNNVTRHVKNEIRINV